MKKRILWPVLFFISGLSPVMAQIIPSSCEVPWVLNQEYDIDVKSLAVKWMEDTQSPDTVFVTIPQAIQDTIMSGIAAVFNSGHLAGDSIFDLYCVHDMAYRPVTLGYMIGISTSAPWIQNWTNMQTMTGVPLLDSLLTAYDFHITGYLQSLGIGIFTTSRLMNPFAVEDSLKWASPYIQYVEPDMLIGAGGVIQFETLGNIRKYTFTFEWNDCFDGCDNYHSWLFNVYPDCSVEYLGYLEGGVFGIEPLPAPINCNISTGLPQTGPPSLMLYPNPAGDRVYLNFDIMPGSLPLFTLTDLGGRMVSVPSGYDGSRFWLETSRLSPGMYFVRVVSKDRIFRGSFLKD